MRRLKRLLNRRSFLGFLGFLALLWSWLAAPEVVSRAARSGLSLCARVLIPSLFPFFVISNLFIRREYHQYATAALRPVMGPLFGLDPRGAGALALGVVGGYPIGAATAFRLYDQKELSAGQTARLLSFCNNAGPGFIFGVVGLGLFGSAGTGALLYAVHLLSALLVGAGLHFWSGPPRGARITPSAAGEREAGEPFAVSFVESVRDAAGTMLGVCAFLVFFSVILAFLRTSPAWAIPARLLHACFGLNETAARALLDGAMELSTGISGLSAEVCSQPALLSVCSFLLGWGGLCVHCQALSLRGQRRISMGPYFLGKLAQGLLAAVLIQAFLHGPWLCAGVLVPLALLLAAGLKFQKNPSGKKRAHEV